LKLLRHISSAEGPVRFSELREVLGGIQDSTLSRTLQNLEADGYLERDGKAGYRAGRALESWIRESSSAPRTRFQLFNETVERLVRETNESAGIVSLEQEERLVAVASQSAPGGIWILEAGSILHFEPDHAAALAVLEQLPRSIVSGLLRGPFSRIDGPGDLKKAMLGLKRIDGCLTDHSEIRPGVSRIARSLEVGGSYVALFLCTTTEMIRTKGTLLAAALNSALQDLEEANPAERQAR